MENNEVIDNLNTIGSTQWVVYLLDSHQLDPLPSIDVYGYRVNQMRAKLRTLTRDTPRTGGQRAIDDYLDAEIVFPGRKQEPVPP